MEERDDFTVETDKMDFRLQGNEEVKKNTQVRQAWNERVHGMKVK
jgi:hypothetical protein